MQITRTEIVAVLRRIGETDRLSDVIQSLPEIVDLDRDYAVLARLGLSRDYLIDRLGGSP